MELLYRLGWTLLQSLWQGAVIAVVLAVVLAALTRKSAQARYAMLIAAMFAISAAFVVTFLCGPPRNLPSPLRSTPISATPALPRSQSSAANRAIGPAAPVLTVPPLEPPAAPSVSTGRWTDSLWQTDLLCQTAGQTWLIGVLLLGAWRMLTWFSVRRLVVLQSAPAEPMVLQAVWRLAQRLDLSKHFEILISRFVETPMVIGWLRPVILIPAAAITGLSPTQLEAILAHELAHIRRHDYLVNLLQILVETLLFYHPAIWWISRRIRLEREQACDDIAVSICGDRHMYAQSLAVVEELRMVGSPALAASGTGGKQMLLRIRRILRPMDAAPRWGISGAVSFLLVAVVGLAVCQRMLADTPKDNSATTRPFKLQNDAPRLSPFTAVRWRGEVAEVQFKNTWYELVSIDELSTSKILQYLQDSKDFAPRKHFAEDLVEVLRDMGHQAGNSVKLELKTLDTKQNVTIPDAPMTEENRKSVLKAGSAPAAAPNVENDRANPAAPATGPSASDSIFKFDVPFQSGKTDFLDGDRITVTDVRGTSPDMESGICCISGTYKLTSHDQAMLGAFVTAANAVQQIGYYNAAQTFQVQKGSGAFTLLLPVNVKGWPHLSFCGEKPAPASQPAESAGVKRKIDYLEEDLVSQALALALTRKELDSLGQKYGTTDLQARDQQAQAQLSALEAMVQQAKITLDEATHDEAARAEKGQAASTKPADRELVYQQIAAVDTQMAANLKLRENDLLIAQELRSKGLGPKNPMVETAHENYLAAQKRVEDYAAEYLDKHQGNIPDNVGILTQRRDALQKMLDQQRLAASDIGAQRQAIEDSRAKIAEIQAMRDRDLRSLDELRARQVAGSGMHGGSLGSFGEIYIGTGDWVLRK